MTPEEIIMYHRLMRAWLWASLVAVAIGAPLSQAQAEDYPTKPIMMIVPYPPGGGVDLIGRLVAQRLTAALGQQVIVENRGGAGGVIGTRDLARAVPDGYTIGVGTSGNGLSANAGYDVNKDFSPIGLIASTSILIVSHPSFPAKTLAEVIALAKQQPGKLSAGTPPAPTTNYFAAELFKLAAGVDVTVVTYKGTAPLTNDLLGNHIPFGFDTIPAAVSNVQAGQLRAIAVTGPTRSAALPDVPTAAESGLPGFDAVIYYGLTAPAGVPRSIIDRLNKELRTMLTDEEFKKHLISVGDDPAPTTPEQYADNIRREEAKWAALVAKLGLKIE
jgi:tripartite-type tricarboxylate transporter receptor subunit TctC